MRFLILYVLTAVCNSLPIPAGIFMPVFQLGAIFGRLFGECMRHTFPEYVDAPGSYAVVGAAAMASSVTQTISTSVIVFELL